MPIALGSAVGFFRTDHHCTIPASTIANNIATQNGGGSPTARGTTEIFASTLSGNTAVDLGGAIMNYGVSGSTGDLTVTRSTLSGNSAGSNGASIANFPYTGSAVLRLSSSIIAEPLAIPRWNGHERFQPLC